MKKSEKRLTICIPKCLLDRFKEACDSRYKTMSEALRDFIQDYIAQTEKENDAKK